MRTGTMSSSSDIEASGSPASGGSTSVSSPHSLQVDFEPLDNFEASQKYSFSERVKHYSNGGIVADSYRNFQLALIFEVGQSLADSGQTYDNNVRAKKMGEMYWDVLKSPEIQELFPGQDPSTIPFFKIIKGAKKPTPITGEQILTKYNDLKRILRNEFMPLCPKDMQNLKSGTGLNDVFKNIAFTFYKEKLKLPAEK